MTAQRKFCSIPQAIEPCFYWGLLAVLMYPVWVHPYIFTTDGPIYLASVQAIVQILQGTCPLAGRMFEINPWLLPNWLGEAIMVVGMLLGLSGPVTEKIIMTLCMVLPAWGVRSIISHVAPGNKPFSVVALPLLGFYLFIEFGTYNYMLGFGLCLVTLGYYLHRRHSLASFHTAALLILTLITWFAHILGFLTLAMAFGLVVLWEIKVKTSGFHIHEWLQVGWREKRQEILILLPGIVLSLIYFSYSTETFILKPETEYFSLLYKSAISIVMMLDMIPYHSSWVLGAITFPTLVYYFCKRRPSNPVAWAFVAMAAITWGLSFFPLGEIAGGWLIEPRLRQIGWYFSIIALSAFISSRSVLHDVLILYAACLVLMLAQEQDYLGKKGADLMKQVLPDPSLIAENSLIYTINLNTSGFVKVAREDSIFSGRDYIFHSGAGAGLGTGRCIVDLNNYRGIVSTFPVRFRNRDADNIRAWGIPNLLPSRELDATVTYPYAEINLAHIEQQAEKPIDYILIWGDVEEYVDYLDDETRINNYNLKLESLPHLEAFIEERYEKIFHSRDDRGLDALRIYKRIEEPAS